MIVAKCRQINRISELKQIGNKRDIRIYGFQEGEPFTINPLSKDSGFSCFTYISTFYEICQTTNYQRFTRLVAKCVAN
jgi:hypothetical protein